MAQRMEDSMMGEDVDPSVEFLYKTMCKVIFIQAETTLMVVALLNLQGEKKGGGVVGFFLRQIKANVYTYVHGQYPSLI